MARAARGHCESREHGAMGREGEQKIDFPPAPPNLDPFFGGRSRAALCLCTLHCGAVRAGGRALQDRHPSIHPVSPSSVAPSRRQAVVAASEIVLFSLLDGRRPAPLLLPSLPVADLSTTDTTV